MCQYQNLDFCGIIGDFFGFLREFLDLSGKYQDFGLIDIVIESNWEIIEKLSVANRKDLSLTTTQDGHTKLPF